MSHGPDGQALAAKAGEQLDYVSRLAKQLGVDDPVANHLEPVLGRWSDLHDEATRWRQAAKTAEDVSHRLTSPLGGLDAAWQGKDADSFLDYMRQVGLAGNDMSDAMTAMADALDKTADSIRQIAQELVDLLSDTADDASDAMAIPVTGRSKARGHLEDLDDPASQLHDSAKQVLAAFTKLCRNVQGGQLFASIMMSHKMPDQNWSPTTTTTSAHHTTPAPTTRPASAPAPTTSPAPAPAPISGTSPVPASTPAPASSSPAPGTTTGPASAPAPAAAHTAAAAHASASGSSHAAAGGGAAPLVGHAANAGTTAGQSGPPPVSAATMSDPTTGSISGQLPTVTGAGGAGGAGGQQSSGMPAGMSGMGGMRGAQGGGDQQHKPKTRLSGDVKDIFGKPDRTAPPTIGDK